MANITPDEAKRIGERAKDILDNYYMNLNELSIKLDKLNIGGVTISTTTGDFHWVPKWQEIKGGD